MRYLLLALPFVLLPNCGGRASSPRGSGGEGGSDSGSSGEAETGGSGSGGKGNSTGGSSSGGKGSSTGGDSEATGGEGGESNTAPRTIEIYFHNDSKDLIFIQWYATYCPALVFERVDANGTGWEEGSVGSIFTVGRGFGFIECTTESTCEYVDSDWQNAPEDLQDYGAYYKSVEPGDRFGLFIRDVSEEDVQVLRDTGNALGVSVGAFTDESWECSESDPLCTCSGDICARQESYEHDIDLDVSCRPGMGFAQQEIDWDSNPIRMDVFRWLN